MIYDGFFATVKALAHKDPSERKIRVPVDILVEFPEFLIQFSRNFLTLLANYKVEMLEGTLFLAKTKIPE